jgi:hypothetical protein
MDPFLSDAFMPALRTLTISNPAGPMGFTMHNLFFQRHAGAILTLHLKFVERFLETSFVHLFSTTSIVKRLTISYYHVGILDEIATYLTPDDPVGTVMRLPKLKSFSLSGSCTDLDRGLFDIKKHEPSRLRAITLMLEQRLVEGNSFRLEFENVLPDWT